MENRGKGNRLTLLAVGDIMPNREEAESLFEPTVPFLRRFDIRFGQLENNLTEKGVPSSVSRAPARAHPRNVRALKFAGFDVVSVAGNHCLDWGPEAMLDSIDLLRKEGIEVVGAGKDFEEARKPVILERKGIKVAFLAYNSILPHGYWADVKKPGCAPIRVRTLYEMIEHDQPGCPPRIFTYAYKEDVEAMIQDIRKVKAQADVLILSLHWGLHFTRAKLATYQQEVGHTAIDAGADIIIGTHAHILKGTEVYKGKVIFYSLGNFALDSSLRSWPNLTPSQSEMMQTYDWVVEPEWARTYPHPPASRKTVAVTCSISKRGIERVSFFPAMINIKAQASFLSSTDPRFKEVLTYVEEITSEAGLNGNYKVEGDEVVVLT